MTRARLSILVAVAVLAAAVLSAAGAQARTPKGFFGVDQGGFVTAPDYRQMHGIKVGTMRIAINWKRVEPKRGTFQWADVDTKVAQLAQNQITPMVFVFGAPAWATGSNNQGVPPLKGGALRKWKAFLQTAVKRFKKGGQFWKTHPNLPVKAVKSWQIWNEPNLAQYFAKAGTTPAKLVPHAPTAYAKFVKASDKAIGHADKHAKVLLAGLSGNAKKKKQDPPKFIKKFLAVKKVTKHFNAAALHPYAPNMKQYKKRVSQFRGALNHGGAKKKGIWLTEVGWGSDHNGKRLNVGLSGQAKLLKKSVSLTLKKRKTWRIKHLFWFDWRDPIPGAPASCAFCPSAGLLRYDGTPKPSYKNFKRFSKRQGAHHRRSRHHHR